MADGFVNLQAELRTVENDRLRALGRLRGGMQRDSLFRDARCVPNQVERFHQFVARQLVLPAKAVRIGALLNFISGKRGRHDSRTGLHLDLMDHRSDRRGEQLLDAAEGHGSFRERHALDAGHFAVGGQQQIQLTFERNPEWIVNVGILPGVLIRLDWHHLDIVALGERRRLGNGDGFSGAGRNSLSRQTIGRGEPPRSLRDNANSNSYRFGFGERAYLAVFCGEIAVANVHHARGLERPIGKIVHHGFSGAGSAWSPLEYGQQQRKDFNTECTEVTEKTPRNRPPLPHVDSSSSPSGPPCSLRLFSAFSVLNSEKRNTESAERTYVPSDQEARYSSCSGVSLSICTPIDSSFSFAICRSMASGTTYT